VGLGRQKASPCARYENAGLERGFGRGSMELTKKRDERQGEIKFREGKGSSNRLRKKKNNGGLLKLHERNMGGE